MERLLFWFSQLDILRSHLSSNKKNTNIILKNSNCLFNLFVTFQNNLNVKIFVTFIFRFGKKTTLNNTVDYSRDGIFEMYGKQYKVAHNALWLRIYHHDSTNNDFFRKDNFCYSTNEKTYAIISDVPYTSLHFPFYTYLLEYKQIPSYQIWRQDNYLNETSVLGYKKLKGDDWQKFSGLFGSFADNCLDHTGPARGYYYSIGTTANAGYDPYFPGPIIGEKYYLVKYGDLWIKIDNIKLDSCKYIHMLYQYSLSRILILIFIII